MGPPGASTQARGLGTAEPAVRDQPRKDPSQAGPRCEQHPDLVKNLILLVAPIDFAANDGLLNLMASEDDLVPCSQGTPFTDLVVSRDRNSILLNGSGHIGLAIGGRAQKEVWPQACEWLAQRSAPVAAKARKPRKQMA